MFRRALTPPAAWPPLALLGLAVAIWFLGGAAARAGEWGIFPLDDAYIHLRLADNWLRGRGFVINPGETAVPESSPLWGALLCLAGVLGAPLPAAAMVLGIACHLALGPLVWLTVHRLARDRLLALLAAATALATGRLVWAAGSGMEITLAAALAMTLLWLDLRWSRRRFSLLIGLVGGLTALARPEAALLVALIAVTRGGRRRLGPWLEAAVAAAAFGVYPLLLWLHTGAPLPPTLSARLALLPARPWLFLQGVIVSLFRRDNAVLAVLLLPAAVAAAMGPVRRRMAALWLWPLGLLVWTLVVIPVELHHSRYLMPMLPALVAAVTASLPRLGRWISPRPRRAAHRLAATGLIGALLTLPLWRQMYALNVSNIRDQQIAVARWINAHVPPGALLAVNDIGAHTYFTDRPVVDLAGLATPSLLPALRRGPVRSGRADPLLAETIERRGVEWVVIFPAWYPLLSRRGDLLEPVASFTLRLNTICGDNTVVIYRVRQPRARL